jgi:Mg-chelatase subunit ChlD
VEALTKAPVPKPVPAPVYPVATGVAAPPSPAPVAKPSRRRRIILSIMAVVGLLYLVGGGVAVYLLRPDKKVAAGDSRPATRHSPSVVIQTIPSNIILPGGDESLDVEWARQLKRMREDGLDLVICFDSTGSMALELRQMQDQIGPLGKQLMELVPSTRISVCTYRGRGHEYLVKGEPLTSKLWAVEEYLRSLKAAGGGDAEAVQEGLRWAVEKNEFRKGAAKVIVLLGDAPPRPEDVETCLGIARDFREKQGGTISTVSCLKRKLPEFERIATAGGGETHALDNPALVVGHVVLLSFGSKFQTKVLEALKPAKR